MSKKIKCQLCGHEVPLKYLSDHRKAETDEIINYTITLIKQRHPSWVEEDGTCKKCWDEYTKLSP